jgi:hypothetical protein
MITDNTIIPIVTLYQYSQVMGLDLSSITQAQKDNITNMLIYSTSLVQTYCDRIFAKQTYSEWYKQTYSNDRNFIYTEQYPINRIYTVGIPEYVGELVSNTAVQMTSFSLFPDSSNVASITYFDNNGDNQEITIPLSTSKTLSALKTNIDASNVYTTTIDAKYVNYPSSQIFPQEFGYEPDLYLPLPTDLKAVKIVENMIELNSAVDNCFIKYNAGYEVAVDNNTNTGLVSVGNMPSDLVSVVCYISNDLLSYVNSKTESGINSNLIKSETILDYSYTKFDDSSINDTVERYSNLLTKYMKKSFVNYS